MNLTFQIDPPTVLDMWYWYSVCVCNAQARQTRTKSGGVAEGHPRFDKGGVAIMFYFLHVKNRTF